MWQTLRANPTFGLTNVYGKGSIDWSYGVSEFMLGLHSTSRFILGFKAQAIVQIIIPLSADRSMIISKNEPGV